MKMPLLVAGHYKDLLRLSWMLFMIMHLNRANKLKLSIFHH